MVDRELDAGLIRLHLLHHAACRHRGKTVK